MATQSDLAVAIVLKPLRPELLGHGHGARYENCHSKQERPVMTMVRLMRLLIMTIIMSMLMFADYDDGEHLTTAILTNHINHTLQQLKRAQPGF